MNDFKWRVWARRVAYWEVVSSFIVILAIIFLVIVTGAGFIVFNDKAHRWNEVLVEVTNQLCADFKITPSTLLFILVFLNFIMILTLIFFIRATYFLLSGTKSTSEQQDKLNTALNECRTWQIVNAFVLVFGILFNVLSIWWVAAQGASHHLPPGKILGHGLTHIGVRQGLHYVVGKYVTELRQELSKKQKELKNK